MNEMTIAQIRRDSGLTQQEMADKLGVSRQTYAKLENDPSKATIEQARLMCRVLGRKYEDIFFAKCVN